MTVIGRFHRALSLATLAAGVLFLAAPALGAIDFDQLEADVQSRRQDFLRILAEEKEGNVYNQIARLEMGSEPVSRDVLESVFDFVDSRKDTASFRVNALVRLAYLHGENPVIPIDIRNRLKQTLLNFKYWVDQPGKCNMIFWTENHFILFSASEYLAGHLYSNEIFPNAKMTGAEHAKKAKPRILRWLRERWRFGFSEWYSPVYLGFSMAPLFNLVDFAPDPEIRTKAAMVLDLAIFDLARLTHRGSFGVTAGRARARFKFSAEYQVERDLIEMLFGTRGVLQGVASPGASSFATSQHYNVPHVLLSIGRDIPLHFVDRSRVSISFSEAKKEGIGFKKMEDGLFWWGLTAHFAPSIITLSRRMITTYDLWHTSYFRGMRWIRYVPGPVLKFLSYILRPFSEGVVLSSANTYTYRNPEVMLSSVQDHRPGQVGFQQHPWQATLGPKAVVWTTMPGELRIKGFGVSEQDLPGEWTGSVTQPRIVQFENVAVILYNEPGLIQRLLFKREKSKGTHAFFPKEAFDEVVSQGKWTFARKGEGYVALYSAQKTSWQTDGQFAGKQLKANGSRNVWICHVGHRAEDGSFQDFMRNIVSARVKVRSLSEFPFFGRQLSVEYDIPGLGYIKVGWRGAPVLGKTKRVKQFLFWRWTTYDWKQIQISNFPRFDNPYAQVKWGSGTVTISNAGATLKHDFQSKTRTGDGLNGMKFGFSLP